jgi:SAM-dependent methyltransferase
MIEFTGERVVPGQTDPDLMNEHLARYCFAEALAGQKRVLDAGCGLAYGSARLARRAEEVFALDNAFDPLREVRGQYEPAGVRFAQGDVTSLPFRSGSFDVVVAFEVIEHLEDWRGFLAEVERVLEPSGQLIVSTPNRLYYEETRDEPNLYHMHEFDYEEFQSELQKFFPHVTIFLENHSNAITFTPLTVQGIRTILESNSHKPEEAHFFLAACSKQPLFGSPAFVYLPESGNVLREREHHIDLLDGEIKQKEKWLAETTAELKQLDEEYRREQKLAQETIADLEQQNARKTQWAEQLEADYGRELEQRTEWAEKLDAELKQAWDNYRGIEQELKKCIALLDDAENRVIERTEWARRLDRELEQASKQLALLYASPAYRFGRRLRLAPEPAPNDPETST